MTGHSRTFRETELNPPAFPRMDEARGRLGDFRPLSGQAHGPADTQSPFRGALFGALVADRGGGIPSRTAPPPAHDALAGCLRAALSAWLGPDDIEHFGTKGCRDARFRSLTGRFGSAFVSWRNRADHWERSSVRGESRRGPRNRWDDGSRSRALVPVWTGGHGFPRPCPVPGCQSGRNTYSLSESLRGTAGWMRRRLTGREGRGSCPRKEPRCPVPNPL